MTYHSSIKPYDLFFLDRDGNRHYYICIYTQELDENNRLMNDIYGLIVTSNQKYKHIPNDYNVDLYIYKKLAFVNCDKLFRIRLTEDITIKDFIVPEEKRKEIMNKTKKFMNEIQKQMEVIL